MNSRIGNSFIILMISIISLALITGCGKDNVKESAASMAPKPLDAELSPGLSVLYVYSKIRHIDQMPSDRRFKKKGKPGPPIKMINHKFGNGNVFDSGQSQGVLMSMNGYLKCPEPGIYTLQAISNDGIRIFVGEKMVLEDPDVHSDRASEPGNVEIASPGWYPLKIKYFQRKGTATLILIWKKPGDAEFKPIAPEFLAH